MGEKYFQVYKSSAGSGKTFTLVREYLTIALIKPNNFRHILAITFTNKAAGEMKERVVKYLKAIRDIPLAEMDKGTQEMTGQLAESTGLEPDDLRERASLVLNNIIHYYSDFAISTIDSFVNRLVRSFAFDLNLPLEFEVELNADELLSAVVEKLLTRVGKNPSLTSILVSFIESRAEEEGSWKIERDLSKASLTLLQEDSNEFISKLRKLTPEDFRNILNKINEEISRFEDRMETLGGEALRLMEENSLSVGDFKHGTQGGAGVFFRKIKNNQFDSTVPGKSLKKSIEVDDSWLAGKADKTAADAIESLKGKFRQLYDEIQGYRDKHEKKYRLFRLLRKYIYQVATLTSIEQVIDEFRKEDHIVHISEFNKRIASVVLEEPVPFIYERIGERYNHFLIDEFQDTSILQWQNLIPLLENGLSSGNMSLVVGDTKQAIYRFRSGEVEQFAKLPELVPGVKDFTDRQRVLVTNYKEENLDTNYRSNKEIVEFNNDFFTTLSRELDEESREYYKEVVQKTNKKKEGYVRLQFFDAKNIEEYHESTMDAVLAGIRELLERNYSLSDIAILFRGNDKASRTARHLLVNGIPVVSSESLLLASSPEVNFLVSWLKYLRNPDQGISMANILSYLSTAGKLENIDLHELFSNSGSGVEEKGQDLLYYLEEKGFKLTRGLRRQSGLYDLAEEIIRVFGLDDKVDPYILFFMDTLLEQSSKGRGDLGEFLDWLDDHYDKLSVVVPENVDAVRVMTIHKAKGLEFPVVLLPFADSDTKKLTKDMLWTGISNKKLHPMVAGLLPAKKELKDAGYTEMYEQEKRKSTIDLLNLVYVAFTRPSERLYVYSRKPTVKSNPLFSIPSMLKHYLTQKNAWDEAKDLFEFGSGQDKAPARKDDRPDHEQGVSRINAMISNSWKGRLLLSYNSPAVWDAGKPSEIVSWGNLVHYILSKITDRTDTEWVLEELMSSGTVTDKEKEELDELLASIFENEEIAALFDNEWEVFTERELIGANGKSRRPDRILRKDGFVKIIDFKTGKRSPVHADQLMEYAGILKEAGYKVKDLFLLYLSGQPELVRLN